MAPLPRAVVKAVPEAPHPPSGETPWVQRVEFCAYYLLTVNRKAVLSGILGRVWRNALAQGRMMTVPNW